VKALVAEAQEPGSDVDGEEGGEDDNEDDDIEED
jgi:hypothetical protein